MKKLFYLFTFLFTNFLMAQAQHSVSINGPSTVEVGVPNNYSFTFNSLPPPPGNSYIITSWVVLTGINSNSTNIPGYINTPSNQSSYYNDSTYNGSNPISIPIQWGDGTNFSGSNDVLTVKVSGIYINSSTGENTGYFNFVTKTQNINIQKIKVPIITGVNSVLNCSRPTSTYSVNNVNATNANKFEWSVTNGAQIMGSNTGTSISVKAPSSGNYSIICKAKRTSANQNYFKETTFFVTRNVRDFSLNTIPNVIDYICKTTGTRLYVINDPEITSVDWTCSNCIVSNEIIDGIRREVTITPNANTTAGFGNYVHVYVTVNFGNCSITKEKLFTIVEPETPPIPEGSIYLLYQSGNTNYGKMANSNSNLKIENFIEIGDDTIDENIAQNNTIFSVNFQPSNMNNNFYYTLSQSTILDSALPKQIKVCYVSKCGGQQSCAYFTAQLPILFPGKNANQNIENTTIIYPNPAKENFTIEFSDEQTGYYKIYDTFGIELINETFKIAKIINVNLPSTIKKGIYLLHINNGIETKISKIMIN
jgi:hypothetical protein